MKANVKVAQLLLLLLLVTGSARGARADEAFKLTARQQEILQTTSQAEGGYITQDLYDEFWRLMPPDVASNRPDAIAMMSPFMRPLQIYTREAWKSALLSFRAHRYLLSADYARAKAMALDSAHRAIGSAAAAPIDATAEKDERLIQAAASHDPYEAPDGRKFYLTEDRLVNTISGLDGSIDRMNLLVAQEWKPAEQDIRMDDISLRALLPWHLARSTSAEELENGLKFLMIDYSGSLDATHSIDLGFVDFGSAHFDDRKAMFDAARNALQAGGLKPSSEPSLEKWQGLDSVVATGTGTTDGQPLTIYTRIFHPHGRNGLTIIVLTVLGNEMDMIATSGAVEAKLAVLP